MRRTVPRLRNATFAKPVLCVRAFFVKSIVSSNFVNPTKVHFVLLDKSVYHQTGKVLVLCPTTFFLICLETYFGRNM